MSKKPPYNSAREAFSHLIKESDEEAYQKREDGNLIVVLFHKNKLTCRLFPSIDAIGKYYSWSIYRDNVFLYPENLSQKFTTSKLVSFHNSLCDENDMIPDDSSPSFAAKKLWGLLQGTSDKVKGNTASSNGYNRRENLYHIDVEKLKSAPIDDLLKGCPKQCRIIAQGLADAEETVYTKDQLNALSRQLIATGKLRTKQDGLRIIMYYAPILAEKGIMEYKRRSGSEDNLVEE